MFRWIGIGAGICFALLVLSVKACALQAVVAHSVFFLPDSAGVAGKPYIETNWQVDPKTLHFMRNGDKKIFAKIRTDIVFFNGATVVSQDHFMLDTKLMATEEEVLDHPIVDLHRYIITTGLITMRLMLTDMTDSNNHFSYTDTFTVAQPADGPYYSSIQPLDTVYASDAETIFQKNGQQQVPYCTNFYDNDRNKLNYYVELYNSSKVPKDEYPLVQHVYISKRQFESAVPQTMKNDTITGAETLPFIGSISLDNLQSGNYYVDVALTNYVNVTIASKTFLIQRYNTKPVKEDTAAKAKGEEGLEQVTMLNISKTFVAKYTLPQIKAILNMLIPVSSPSDVQNIRSFLKKPDDMYIRYFIYNHFVGINKDDPEKAWKEYSERVKEVNKLFGSPTIAGYETERGYVYLKYGAPTERISVENESGAYPYEIWQYNVLAAAVKNISNAIFLFYRPADEVSDFRLLHSTVPGEVRNKAWRSYLYTSGNGGSNLNARAEQYLGDK